MKDAFGHGSNSREGSLTAQLRARLAHVTSLKGAPSGGVAMTSNQTASDSLMSTLKSTQAPVHDSMDNREIDRRMAMGLSKGGLSLGDRYAVTMARRNGYDVAIAKRSGGQAAVNSIRGGGKDWSSNPLPSTIKRSR